VALAIFPADIYPTWDGYAMEHGRDVAVLRFGRGGYEQRIARDGGAFRAYTLTLRLSDADRKRVEAFLSARGYEAESFLWRDPFDSQRDGVSLGTAVAAQTVFSLPTTGDGRGDYPIDAGGTSLRDDGVTITRTVQTDDRTLTASGGAPGASSVMTADVAFYKRVRLDGRPRWTPLGEGAVYETQLRFVEVPA